jgi:hypothetical protein
MQRDTVTRVLAIDPFSRGVGFAVLEGPDLLIDWGLKTTGHADNEKAIRAIETLVARFQPDVLAVEDSAAVGSRRCDRVQTLLDQIVSAKSRHLPVRLVSRHQLSAIGPLPQANTKYGRACLLAERFPELQPSLPRFRKAWMSEDDRMAIFDAVGFAVVCFPRHKANPADQPSA